MRSCTACCDQLTLHFALEEAYGYFDDAMDVAPQLSEVADELRTEHEGLFVELCGIVEHAERVLYNESPAYILGFWAMISIGFANDFGVMKTARPT